MVSEGAKQLYDYMVANATEGGYYIYYEGTEQFQADYRVWLDELMSEGWINDAGVNVSLGRLRKEYWKDNCQDTKQERMLERYPPGEREVVEAALQSFGGKRRSGKLTPRQTLIELEYYFKFPRPVVIRGLRTYLNLPPGKQYGEAYARGIIRGEVRNNTQVGVPVQTTPAPQTYEEEKRKAEWIRSRISEYDLMNARNPEALDRLIEQLEEEYERQKAP